MKPSIFLTIAGLSLAVLAGACGKKSGLAPVDSKVFANAAPEIKELWTLALEAEKTNDYYKAEVLLYEMRRMDLPKDQFEATGAQVSGVHRRMLDAMSKGDPAATASYEQFRSNPPNRPAPMGR